MKGKVLSLGAVRRLNQYEACGSFGARASSLEDLVLEHVQLVRDLESLTALEELVVRMTVEGYTSAEIGVEGGVSERTVTRTLQQLRMTLLREDPRGAGRGTNGRGQELRAA